MPPLQRPHKHRTVRLPPREAVVAGRADVLVVGAGPAGLGAALGAAQAGARVILVERYGFAGGNATVAMVAPLMSSHTRYHKVKGKVEPILFPTDHGEGELIIEGAVALLLKRLIDKGGALPPTVETGYVVPFDHEIFKEVALELLDEAGVHYLFHSFASGVSMEPHPRVTLETKSGPLVMEAGVVVDATGDGDIAAWAGADFELGNGVNGHCQPMSLYFRMGDFSKQAFFEFVREHPDEWSGVVGLSRRVKEARARGEWNIPRENVLLFGTPHDNEVSINCTRVLRVQGTDVWDLTRAEWHGRFQMRRAASFLRKHIPGFKGAYVVQSGSQIGVRETRHIVGEYQLTADDIIAGRRFTDVIARSTYPIDIHNPHGEGTTLVHLPHGMAYDVPLRCLLPRHVDHIITAGRCISGTHEAHSSFRVMPVAMATGQAAGACAALAVRKGVQPRNIASGNVQEELRRQGANLG
ncbi:MAG: FAD-dependent oxidoreductase [Chitinivibrionales bacterium]|nr:FAD-dependent oxidoreductase [Chitinivibrionales bacterium]MBD3358440.1 FAD-dependent oxidoreductase [Chitinivibrionales bacterium]